MEELIGILALPTDSLLHCIPCILPQAISKMPRPFHDKVSSAEGRLMLMPCLLHALVTSASLAASMNSRLRSHGTASIAPPRCEEGKATCTCGRGQHAGQPKVYYENASPSRPIIHFFEG